MFDFVLLFEKEYEKKDGKIQITSQYPEGIEFLDREIIEKLCIPRKLKKSDIFMFNTPNSYCYTYSFVSRISHKSGNQIRKKCSIVIISSHFRPSLFIDFLASVSMSFSRNEAEPLCRFVLVQSLLISWSTNNDGDLIVNYPYNTFIVSLNDNQSWTNGFNIAPLFPYVDNIWNAAIRNKGILIYAPTSALASSSTLAIFSIIEPFVYSEPYLNCTQRGDPRISKVYEHYEKTQSFEIEGPLLEMLSQYKIISTTDQKLFHFLSNLIVNSQYPNHLFRNPSQNSMNDSISDSQVDSFADPNNPTPPGTFLSSNSLFKAVIKINEKHFVHMNDLKSVYTKKTRRIIRQFNALLNFSLLSDPYFDILHKHVEETEFTRIWPNENRKELYADFQNTMTFKKWRHIESDREQLRTSFLSVPPKEAVEKVPPELCKEAIKQIHLILNAHKRDEHFGTILKLNLSLLKKKIKNVK
ncbi:hypothetical protein TRFO_10926 [Tritrichomonas foetus]|uniref:UDENN domain-containing protein n=1 Tax=Tritrichomonas foetus TaxID=1144522 RepID=A0A1J4JBF0_9EUKA|nr:hypothetical protein TRFO_10926 [Tritrichomonas foetus]|eukprot:OHS94757.1 hypothetical protein TRFO_10926 [Tritrichomonas foetus]